MDDGLKQRLIGAVVLIAIAVLFLPTLFGTDGRRTVDLATQVPPRPVIVAEPLELSIPSPAENVREAKPLSENYDHNTIEPVLEIETSSVSDVNDSGQAQSLAEQAQLEAAIEANEPASVSAPQPTLSSTSGSIPSSTSQPQPQPQPQPKPEPVLNADGVPRGWSIQVASFSEIARAEAMLKNLEKAGYPKSYIRSGKGPKGEVYRVFVGPKINKQQAETEQLAINKALKVKSLLVKFQP